MHDRASPIANGTKDFEQWGVYDREEDGVTADTFTNTLGAVNLPNYAVIRVLDHSLFEKGRSYEKNTCFYDNGTSIVFSTPAKKLCDVRCAG
ncbi:hypothetical protein J26TS2_41010 [Shouchella clausii]|nr:hypothetical protein J26TS2_41010 [Shouchella clausii]